MINKNDIQGRWWKIKNNIKKSIPANYDKIKDFVLDPKGYFLIKIDKEKDLLRVGYCIINYKNGKEFHEMIYEIIGKSAIEIVNTIIKENFFSSQQHAADMGIELTKAEIALKYKLEYIQDKDLVIPLTSNQKDS